VALKNNGVPANLRIRTKLLAHNLESVGTQITDNGFPDVTAAHWASASIALVQNSGIMQGDKSGLFHPGVGVTRAEMAQIIATWKKLQLGQSDSIFTDTKGHWASQAIAAVQGENWMVGYQDGTFGPNRPLTRAETVKVLNRLLDRPTMDSNTQATWKDVPLNHWAFADIEAASHTFTQRP
jgi:hypothetical protein